MPAKIVMISAILGALLLTEGCTRGGPPVQVAPQPSRAGELGDFALLDDEGTFHSLYFDSNAKAVVIVGQSNHCPVIAANAARLNSLNEKYAKSGVRFYLLNSETDDSRDAVIRERAKLKLKLAILLDPSQTASRELGIPGSGTATVIDPKSWHVAIRTGLGGDALEGAIQDLLAGRAVRNNPDGTEGKKFIFRDLGRVDYARDVVPILRAKCLGCHSPETSYKPVFSAYGDVKGWAAMIRETVMKDSMPPFSADTYYAQYSNDISLSAEEKAKLVTWIDSGMPRGEGADTLGALRRRKGAVNHPQEKIWDAGMEQPQKIGPKGTVEYLYFQVGGPAPRNLWVTGVETISSNPRQLHHSSLLVLPKPWSWYGARVHERRDESYVKAHPDGDVPLWNMEVVKDLELGSDKNFIRIGAWAAGRKQPRFLGDGRNFLIPKGYYVVLEVHYVGNGREDEEQTKINFYGYTDETKPKDSKSVHVMWVINPDFEIPAGVRRFKVEAKGEALKKDIKIVGLLSHMHMRGRAVKLIAVEPNGKERILTSIPNFDFNWQSGVGLSLKAPALVKAGTTLKAECEYDNTSQNPRNPDPSKSVKQGQTLDRAEMCKFMFQYLDADAAR